MRSSMKTVSLLIVTGLAAFGGAAQTLTDEDVGYPSLAGSMKTATDASGSKVFTIIGGGSDIWNNADGFHYAYLKVTGDFDYMVKVEDLQGPDTWSKAELMARQFDPAVGTPQAGDPHIANMTTRSAGQNQLGPQWRVDRDGVSDSWAISPTVNPTYPNTWLRMERLGSKFFLYYSADGSNWNQYANGGSLRSVINTAGSQPVGGDNSTYFTNAWPNTILLGLAVTAHNDTDANGATAVFSNFKPHVATAVAITAQPDANVTVTAYQPLKLSVSATGDPLHFQWRKNGTDIPGATEATYGIQMTKPSDAGTYSVKVFNSTFNVISADAVVTIAADTTPPRVVLASTSLGKTVKIEFDEYLDTASANTAANYSIANVTISSATIATDLKTVNLAITGTLPANFEVTLGGVKDLSGNAIPANTKVTGYTTGLAPNMVSYWPLDKVEGTKTPDIISGYDLNLENMTEANLVAGRFGKCFEFDNARKALLKRVHSPDDLLPIYKHTAFTVSIWVNGPIQTDHRVYCETSSKATQPMFSIGTHQTTVDGTVDSYIRNDSNTTTGDHHHSIGVAFDETWHHICWVQNSNATPRVILYIDGVKDDQTFDPIWPLTIDTTCIGAIQRASAAAWFTGKIDDVAVWNRPLDPDEVSFLFTKGTPTPPPKVLPLAISTFQSELPAVAKGDSVTLRWDVSKDATSVAIQPDVGDVTAKTAVGVGSITVPITTSKTFRMTVKRGNESVFSDIQVAAIDGIAANWNLLDNFDRYAVGALPKPWGVSGANVTVVNVSTNRMLSVAGAADTACRLLLNDLTIKEGDQRTLFARFYLPQSVAAGGIVEYMGLSDKGIRGYGDSDGDLGPDVAFQNPNGTFQIGTWNGYGSPLEFASFSLQPQTVYNLWMDIRNDPIATGDLVTTYIAKDGEANRTVLFQDYRSDRNPSPDPGDLVGYPTKPDLTTLQVAANSTSSTVYFDDFYLSKSGYNTTVPRVYGFTTPFSAAPAQGPTLKAVRIDSGNCKFDVDTQSGANYVVEARADLATGTWQTVQTVTGTGQTVTVTIPMSGNSQFFRTRVQ